jgi:hypothetical protein
MTGPIHRPIHERDWKYLRSIHDELLHELCSRINGKAVELATAEEKNPHERFQALYRHLQKSDDIVAPCFDDWARSSLDRIIVILRHNRLLADEHVKHLSPEAQEWLTLVESSMQKW